MSLDFLIPDFKQIFLMMSLDIGFLLWERKEKERDVA